MATEETTKLTGGAGEIFLAKMGWEEPVLARWMEGNWKPGCLVMTTAGSLLPFRRSFCGLRVMEYDIKDDTGDHEEEEEEMNLEAGEDGLMKNTSQQGRCRGGRSGTWK